MTPRRRAPERRRRALFDWRYVPVESRRSYRMACILFWSILMYGIIHRYALSLAIVTDRSMLPTMADGNHFLVNRYVYHFRRPARGEIVVVRAPGDETRYVKRVVALGGEELRIHAGRVYVNGRRLSEPYALGWTFPEFGPVVLAPERYFVMGDNREESFDSRQFGAVAREAIEGKIEPGRLFAFD